MTQLYKKNGAVFILAGITIEEVERIEKENEGFKAFDSHDDEIEEDAKAIAKENAELKAKLDEIKNYLTYDIPHELMNEATNKIWKMI